MGVDDAEWGEELMHVDGHILRRHGVETRSGDEMGSCAPLSHHLPVFVSRDSLLGFSGNHVSLIATPLITELHKEVRSVGPLVYRSISTSKITCMTSSSVVCLCDTRPTVTHSPQRANQFRRRIVFVNHKAGCPHCFSTYVYKGQIHLAEKSSLDLPFRKQASQDSHHHHRRNQGCTYFTTAKRLWLRLALMMGSAVSTQFSNFAHDCQGTEFNGDSTTVIGTNCHSDSSNTPHTSWLNLDLCLSYAPPNLVAHQG